MRLYLLALVMCQLSFTVLAGEREALIIKGEYLVRAAGCVSCHTDHDNKGKYLAGGRALKTPFGTFYTPNITSDSRHGIGGWSEQDLKQALREGVAPDGSHYYPAFPYSSYTNLRDQDIHAMAAYLRTVKAVSIENREHKLPWYLFRWTTAIWKGLYFQPGEFVPNPNKTSIHNRGAYLVAIGHCTECHTPRNAIGALDNKQYLAGVKNGPEGESIPNITPDRKTGIGRWSQSDLSYFLKSGEYPDGDYSGSLMAEVIDDGSRYLRKDDLDAMAFYLRSVKPMLNETLKKKQKKRKKKAEEEW